MRNAECGVGKSLCLLVNGEVWAARNEAGFAGPEAGIPVQKKRPLGSLQTKYFSTPLKTRFFGRV